MNCNTGSKNKETRLSAFFGDNRCTLQKILACVFPVGDKDVCGLDFDVLPVDAVALTRLDLDRSVGLDVVGEDVNVLALWAELEEGNQRTHEGLAPAVAAAMSLMVIRRDVQTGSLGKDSALDQRNVLAADGLAVGLEHHVNPSKNMVLGASATMAAALTMLVTVFCSDLGRTALLLLAWLALLLLLDLLLGLLLAPSKDCLVEEGEDEEAEELEVHPNSSARRLLEAVSARLYTLDST